MERLENISEDRFADKSRAELVALFANLLDSEPIESLRRTVEQLKVAFYKVPANVAQPSSEDVAEGVEAVESSVDTDELRLKELIKEYRVRRDAHIAQQESMREENLKAKVQIIEELKELTESDEMLEQTFTKFRDLQERWRAAGQVPVQNMKDVWERYHLYTENFYGVIKINRELRDLDLKRNLEAKVALCEAAEALLHLENVVEAFGQLQPLHDQWREIGPVEAEQKEAIWLRFKEASSIINKHHLEYFEAQKAQQQQNLERKEALCAEVEQINSSLPESHKGWSDASDRLQAIQTEWKQIGFAPKKDNAKIYERLRAACDDFFAAKRDFHAESRSEQEHNLELKRALCESAEQLSSSDEWREASAKLIELQAEWKQIGAVPRRYTESVWKRFRAACDTFFERKSAHFESQQSGQMDNLKAKEAILTKIEAAIAAGEISSVDVIKGYQREWSDVGHVPIKFKDALQSRYKELVDSMFNVIRSGERERTMGAFRSRVSQMKGDGKMGGERERLATKVKQLTADIAQLENNVGFFALSKGAESMVADVNRKIEKLRAELTDTKSKIKMIDIAAREAKKEEN
ncbi:MAG: DUF349 domain-containing protein [Rikenellaceae bacterium]